ncbi:hypothetical protein K440DRAFT_621034 [Wilcoxina mikolae CBS 423.85]|nr:hypothetical protein K440DRAFT_621034 [Wilcoxina mikolae CBS 423.85]
MDSTIPSSSTERIRMSPQPLDWGTSWGIGFGAVSLVSSVVYYAHYLFLHRNNTRQLNEECVDAMRDALHEVTTSALSNPCAYILSAPVSYLDLFAQKFSKQ